MIDLGLSQEHDIVLLSATVRSVEPTDASSVAALDHGGDLVSARAPWEILAGGRGWSISWRRSQALVGLWISRATFTPAALKSAIHTGNVGFSLAIVQQGHLFFARRACVLGFGLQGDHRHLILGIPVDDGELK